MIGILDSGIGGENTLREIRRRSNVDAVLMKDTKNAPYGVLTEEELIPIIERNVCELISLGASTVLLACCTASSVWHRLGTAARTSSIPIIVPTAAVAREKTKTKRVAVMATSGTVARHAFAKALRPIEGMEIAAGELVSAIEGGVSDDTVTPREIKRISSLLSPLSGFGADTLVLGCTHFPSLERTVRTVASRYGIKHIVSSAEAGASALLGECRECGTGKTVIIDTGRTAPRDEKRKETKKWENTDAEE